MAPARGIASAIAVERVIFRVWPLRFEFEASEALRFPPGKTGNALRGALGQHLPEGLFAPRGEGPSGFQDLPRPFVLRASDPEGRRLAVQVNAFQSGLFAPLKSAFEQITHLGPHRIGVRLVEASALSGVQVDLAAATAGTRAIRLRFLTPMELKFENSVLREPRFDALFARVRDRVSSLSELYQGAAPDADYRELGERARAVTMTGSRIEQRELERRSSRTGQRHGLGGFIGEAEYAGDLSEFLPWLKAGEWTGVGRHTVWGNGQLLATDISRDQVSFRGYAGG